MRVGYFGYGKITPLSWSPIPVFFKNSFWTDIQKEAIEVFIRVKEIRRLTLSIFQLRKSKKYKDLKQVSI